MENKLFFEGYKNGDSSKNFIVPFDSVDIIGYDSYYHNIEIILKRDGTTVKIKCSSEKNLKDQLESYRMYLSGDIKEKIKI
jgi:hypothetical protein